MLKICLNLIQCLPGGEITSDLNNRYGRQDIANLKKTSNDWLGKNNESNVFQGFDCLVRLFNYVPHKDLIHPHGAGSLVW